MTYTVRRQRKSKELEVKAKVEKPNRGELGDSHPIGLLSVPLTPPLASGLAVSLQPLLVDLLPLLLPAQVLRPLPARHGERHVTGTTQASPAALPHQQTGSQGPIQQPTHPHTLQAERESQVLKEGTGLRLEPGLLTWHLHRD